MRRVFIPAALLLALYFDTIFFQKFNINGICPDVLMAVIVSIGVLRGQRWAGAIGLGMGLFMDVMFGRLIGLNAVCYMVAGVSAGIFYNKFYADNVIIPAAVAFCGAVVKGLIHGVALKLLGGNVVFTTVLTVYTLPSALLTAGTCALVHIVFKPMLLRQVKAAGRQTSAPNKPRMD